MAPLDTGIRPAFKAHRLYSFPQLVRQYVVETSSPVLGKEVAGADSLMSKMETESSLATEPPKDAKIQRKIRNFNPRGRAMARRYELPGSRFQYHPPKYDKGPLHPIQPLKSSEPTSRQFVPGPFSIPRLKQTFYDAIAHDLLILGYEHKIPGSGHGKQIPHRHEDRLKTWDDSSPYHKNRPPAAPRRLDRLPLIEKSISHANIPQLESIAISSHLPQAHKNRDVWMAAWTAVRAISGRSPYNIRTKTAWNTTVNKLAGVKIEIKGNQAWEFFDKLVSFVMPRIKDWPGLEATTGDQSGNVQLGLRPECVTQFPEILANLDMYPPKLVPGLRISIKTTGQSNRHSRLLLQALGVPLIGKPRV